MEAPGRTRDGDTPSIAHERRRYRLRWATGGSIARGGTLASEAKALDEPIRRQQVPKAALRRDARTG